MILTSKFHVIKVFETVARKAVRGLWNKRSQLGLVGAHINVLSGEWTHKVCEIMHCRVYFVTFACYQWCIYFLISWQDAGIGTSIDSFYEYLLKVSLAFSFWP